MKKSILVISLAAVTMSVSSAVATDFSAWPCKVKITFSGYDKPETLANFPALVVLGTNITNFSYGQFAAPTNGGDLRFGDSNDTSELNYEIEEWNTNGNSCVWVQLPALAGTNTFIWGHWGNPDETNPPSYTTNGATWSEGYEGVWHLSEGGTAVRRDSSANANHSDSLGGDPESTNGVIARGNEFDGNDYLRILHSASIGSDVRNGFTISTWLKPVATLTGAGTSRALEKGDCYFFVEDLGTGGMNLLVKIGGANKVASIGVGLNSNQWYLLTGTFDGFDARVYLDGVYRGLSNVGGPIDDDGLALRIGSDDGGKFFNGVLDEVRISSVPYSSNWIWACWMNEGSHDAFNRYGRVTQNMAPRIGNAGASNVTFTSAYLNGTLTSTGAGPTEVWAHWGPSDGGSNAAAWANTNYFGTNAAIPPVSYTTNVTGLSSNLFYYYRYRAANADGTNWASVPATFMTGEARVQATDANASESGFDNGQIAVYRPGTCTNGPVTVNFTMGGTAIQGSDYENIGSSILIPAGATSSVITITPINDAVWFEGNESAALTLSSGGYVIGSPSNASVTISDNDVFSAWRYRMRITFTGYTGAETLTNFPALVIFGTNITGFSYSRFAAPADGGDLRFGNSNETAGLNHEIEEWNTNGNSYVWVQVPELAPTTTHIFAYWGNPSETNQPSYSFDGSTWSEGYLGVWHFGRTNGVESLADSSANGYDGADNGSDGGSASVNGMISYAQDFESTNSNYINLVPSSNFLPTTNSPITISCWINPESIGGTSLDNRIVNTHYGTPSGTTLFLGCGAVSRLETYWNGSSGGTTLQSVSPLNLGVWQHTVVTYDGFTVKLYLDAVLENSGVGDMRVGSPSYLAKIAAYDGSSRYFDGTIDEVRISSTARSQDWIRACRMNQASNELFNLYGGISGRAGTILTLK